MNNLLRAMLHKAHTDVMLEIAAEKAQETKPRLEERVAGECAFCDERAAVMDALLAAPSESDGDVNG